MGFLSVYPHHFRNLSSEKVNTRAKIVYLVGTNGQGKTNFLEAIYLICFGSSFRTTNNEVLVQNGEEEAVIHGEFMESEIDDRLDIAIKIRKGKKEIIVNGKKIKDRKELVQNIPCIVFSHEDIEFVKGSPERKRFFFNQVMSLYKPTFIDALRSYNKILKMRNTELKEGNIENLDIYDCQLAEYGKTIQSERQKTADEFNTTFSTVYTNIYKTLGLEEKSIQIRYTPSWKGCEKSNDILQLLVEKRENDRRYQFTTTGPHRDRFQFRKDEKNFSWAASTGQFRLAALILRVAQAVFFNEKTGRKPVLLLDDVLLELDGRKKEAFLKALPDFDQAFFTFLPEENFFRFYSGEDILMYNVEQGVFGHEESR